MIPDEVDGRPDGTDVINDSLEMPEPHLDPGTLEHLDLDEVAVPDAEELE